MSMNVTLNNGVVMPALGFGVFQTPAETTAASVAEALRVGYRLIDTAASYFNEREVGEGIRRAGLGRSEVFVETKVWISDYGYDQTLHAFDKSAGKLGVEQIDLLLLHQPLPTDFDKTVGAYKALETLLDDGRVRAIGVSNFMPDVLDRLLEQSSVVPAVNQVEVHPYFTQPEVQKANAAHAILTQAWSPMGGITSYRGGSSGSTFIRSRDRPDRPGAREGGCSGHVALAPAGGPVRDPEVGQPRADRRELRRVRLRAVCRAARRDRRAEYRRARWAGAVDRDPGSLPPRHP
jgi:diketogulonate reductase-like aldo/keto reductase